MGAEIDEFIKCLQLLRGIPICKPSPFMWLRRSKFLTWLLQYVKRRKFNHALLSGSYRKLKRDYKDRPLRKFSVRREPCHCVSESSVIILNSSKSLAISWKPELFWDSIHISSGASFWRERHSGWAEWSTKILRREGFQEMPSRIKRFQKKNDL